MQIGDIVVTITSCGSGSLRLELGAMAEITNVTKSELCLTRQGNSSNGSPLRYFRETTEKEIRAYKQGITNINNIPEDFQLNLEIIPLIFN
jgi:hypothetical protein